MDLRFVSLVFFLASVLLGLTGFSLRHVDFKRFRVFYILSMVFLSATGVFALASFFAVP